MDFLHHLLIDWEACVPEGSVIPIKNLQQVLDRATARVFNSPAVPRLQQDALDLLKRGEKEAPSLLEMMLLRQSNESGGIHFMRFWQAWQELARRLGLIGDPVEEPPLLEELVVFRDALIRCLQTPGGLTAKQLATAVSSARGMSADEDMWAPLEESVVHLGSSCGGGKAAKHLRGSDQVVHSDGLCALLLIWLKDVSDDYRRGPRKRKIKAVRDVCKCTMVEACLQLGGCAWDVEKAIRSIYAKSSGAEDTSSSTSTICGWSSQGARLKQSEVECPICCENYGSRERVVAKCCFQVMCGGCSQRLLKAGKLSCPFCRTIQTPDSGVPPPAPAPASGAAVSRLLRARGYR